MDILRSWLASISVYLLLNYVLSLILSRELEEVYLLCPFVAGIVASIVHLISVRETKRISWVRHVIAVLGGVFVMGAYYNFIVLFNLDRPFFLGLWGVLVNLAVALIGAAVVLLGRVLIFRSQEVA